MYLSKSEVIIFTQFFNSFFLLSHILCASFIVAVYRLTSSVSSTAWTVTYNEFSCLVGLLVISSFVVFTIINKASINFHMHVTVSPSISIKVNTYVLNFDKHLSPSPPPPFWSQILKDE